MSFPISGTARVVRDVELKYTESGTPIAQTAIVRSDKFKNKAGELMEDACFIDVKLWGDRAEWLNTYIQKGTLLEFEGHLKQDRWEDKDGNKRSKHFILLSRVGFSQCKKSETGGGGGHAEKDPYERGTPVAQYQGSGQAPAQNQATQQSAQPQQAAQPQQPSIPEIDINEDEIPF